MDWRVATIQKTVQENYSNADLTLSSIGRNLHVSPNYLGRLFFREVGRHIPEYILSVRLSRACELLGDPTLTAKEIAHKVGFRAPGAFFRAFRSYYGLTPRQYRI